MCESDDRRIKASNVLGHGIGAILMTVDGRHYLFTARLNLIVQITSLNMKLIHGISNIKRNVKTLQMFDDSTLVIYQLKREWHTRDSKLIQYGKYYHHNHDNESPRNRNNSKLEKELETLKSQNRRLRSLLEQNLKLLNNLSESPALLNDCPPDLNARLVSTVDSKDFFTRLNSLNDFNTKIEFPFEEATGDDMHSTDVLINVDQKEPSWWVWVTDEMVPSNVEEWSGIDDENYLVVSEEHVVDGVANFMAQCILLNPKAQTLTPEELQKTLLKALGSVSKLEKVLSIWHAGKMFYALSTWGLALAGFYKTRAIVKVAAMRIHTSSKVVRRAL